ncbi:MAG: DEAD/DEAH box helicase [Bacteroidetes bacterium]|nr:DEAD/DEAH box helicase [Bacteroidota bacterium]
MSFEEMGIEESILRSIKEIDFINPTPIQERVIPALIHEEDVRDIIALAQTGTGKTAAYGIPLIQRADASNRKIQFLILSPTRELCIQIADDLATFAKYLPEIKIVPVFGGASIERQIQSVRKGAHIISATPGRLVDLIRRRIVDLSKVQTVVLDEADEMLNMGFRDELESILDETPAGKNTLLFSATMPSEVRSMANKYMSNPVEITVGKKNAGAENINHVCYLVHARDRYLALKRIVDFHPEIYGIVFCRTRKETQEVSDQLIKDGYNADALHGDLSQVQRDVVMNKFRIKHLQLLVATDVAARGLDVDSLTHIINYNLPEELEIYTHRSGRTGRAGRTGTSVVIANLKEKNKIYEIEKRLNKKFTFAHVPLGKEVCEKQLFHLIDKMEKVEVDSSEIEPFLAEINRKLEWLERDELIKKFVSLEFNRFLDYYKNTPDLNVPDESKPGGGRSKGAVDGFTRFFINLGRLDELKPKELMGLISDFTGIRDIEIGEIKILNTFSFFEADSKFKDIILKSFAHKEYKDRRITLEESQSKGKEKGKPERGKSFKEGGFKRERSFRDDSSRGKKKFRTDRKEKENGFQKEKRNKYGPDRKRKR